jgi:hypothetical protein
VRILPTDMHILTMDVHILPTDMHILTMDVHILPMDKPILPTDVRCAYPPPETTYPSYSLWVGFDYFSFTGKANLFINERAN